MSRSSSLPLGEDGWENNFKKPYWFFIFFDFFWCWAFFWCASIKFQSCSVQPYSHISHWSMKTMKQYETCEKDVTQIFWLLPGTSTAARPSRIPSAFLLFEIFETKPVEFLIPPRLGASKKCSCATQLHEFNIVQVLQQLEPLSGFLGNLVMYSVFLYIPVISLPFRSTFCWFSGCFHKIPQGQRILLTVESRVQLRSRTQRDALMVSQGVRCNMSEAPKSDALEKEARVEHYIYIDSFGIQ